MWGRSPLQGGTRTTARPWEWQRAPARFAGMRRGKPVSLKNKNLSSAMMEVRGTLPPNRHVARSCRWAASGSFVVLGPAPCPALVPAAGRTAQAPNSPGPSTKGLGEKSPLAFLGTASSPRTPRAGQRPCSHRSGHSSCSGGSNPQTAFTKPHPHQAPMNSASSRHGTGPDQPHGGRFPPVGPHSSFHSPIPGGSPRTHPHTHSPAEGTTLTRGLQTPTAWASPLRTQLTSPLLPLNANLG